ncbi:MAG: hypothetical protein U9Q30_02600 [Campylobacterota bacterium]|nr:hypothetical protein [Campylobacterota bacterium]
MKNIKNILLISLLSSSFIIAETLDETPPTPDYSFFEETTQCSEDSIDKIVEEEVAKAINNCKVNPASCGITSTDVITTVSTNELEIGWHLLGSSIDINGTSNIPNGNIVWRYENSKWLAYSSNTAIQNQIEQNTAIGTFSNIPKNSGFWILKK